MIARACASFNLIKSDSSPNAENNGWIIAPIFNIPRNEKYNSVIRSINRQILSSFFNPRLMRNVSIVLLDRRISLNVNLFSMPPKLS
jgi:hypothetical protein